MPASTAEDDDLNLDDDQNQDDVNPLDMSDDDFNDLNLDDLPEASDEEAGDLDDNDNDDDDEDDDDGNDESGTGTDDGTDDGAGDADDGDGTDSGESGSGSSGGSSDDDGDGSSDGTGAGSDDESGGSGDADAGGDSSDGDSDGDSDTDDSTGKSKSVSDEESLDYKAEHSKLLAPFRANGKDMQVESVDDARTLMQMGANYNKKMAGLKPNLKLMKMLDNNGLLNEDKLSFLIDLDKKDPEAVKKFLQDGKVNPLEIDLDSDNEYKSSTYTVNDNEVELDGILEDIKDTESFSETIDIISNKWDESSKQVLLENPSVIKLINEHVATGVYGKIVDVMDKDRMLGKLTGLSDLEAYQQVGNAINAAGGFDEQPPGNTDKAERKTTSKKKTVDPKLRSRKKAASSTKTKAGAKGSPEFNPLSMSDEDFENAGIDKFL